ncbi:hypothetical protein A8990_11253 [Paenibacillus taihuensis]|uniref:Uncharacterized protein n=1 Tax=Paenibacillus taihuensis TaxID=1156355 RepID=A0A3D9RZ31_9BACL|nr:hypothetical protein A8990_11253 [Paenibacillus taihuensis]
MNEKRLIIIDGMPGSGKTTMATHVAGNCRCDEPVLFGA